MITVNEAYQIIKKQPNKNYLLKCIDFGGFYGFVFSKRNPSTAGPFGGAIDCVDKEDGRVFAFNPFDNFGLFDKGVPIPLEDIR